MAIISKCPKCDEAVTIPDAVEAEAAVRCPLCEAEYPLGEAFDALPPALIPVDTAAAAAGLKPDSDAMLKSDLVSEPFHVPESDDAEAAAEMPSEARTGLDFLKKEGVGEAPQIDLGHGAVDTGAGAADFAGFAEEPSDEDREPISGEPVKARPRRKRKSKHMGRLMAEAIGGGVVGLLIGYYLLAWFGGSRVDLPKLPLPFLPPTMNKAADAPTEPGQQPEPSAQKPAPEKPQQPKRPGGPNAGNSGEGPRAGPKPPVEPAEPEGAAEPPEPQPEPLPDDYVGPKDSAKFTSAELGKALKAANDAVYGEDATGEITDKVYQQLCHLGHVLTFAKGGAQLGDRKQAVRMMLERLGENQARANEIGQLAGGMADSADGTSGGILLAGTAGKTSEQGGLHGTVIHLAGHPTQVIVMSDRPLPFDAEASVVLLGSIINNPAENLVGYSGTKPYVVWIGTAVTTQ